MLTLLLGLLVEENKKPELMNARDYVQADLSDAEIVSAVLSGERDSYRVLVERHQGYIYRLICRQVRSEDLAEELAQETFIRAFKGLKGFKKDSSFSTWLTRIAMNVTNSYFSSKRFKQRRQNVSLEGISFESLSQSIEEQSTEYTEQLSIIIGELKPRYREVVVLCYIEGYTYPEIAARLNIPYGTVCSRMNKALQMLRTKIKRFEQ